MIKHTVMYYALTDEERFDEEYYRDVQLRDALSFVGRYGCRRLELSKAIYGIPERHELKETFYRSMEMWFDSVEDAIRCIYSPEMLALDARFRESGRFQRRAATMIGEVDGFTFDEAGQVVTADGPWSHVVTAGG